MLETPFSPDAPAPRPTEVPPANRRSAVASPIGQSLIQSLMLLGTMTAMLYLAQSMVPRVVEEIRYGWHRGQLRSERELGIEGLQNVSLDSLSAACQMVTQTVGPSVVHIDVDRPDIDLGLLGTRPSRSDQGSGVVVDTSGHILTNRHVVGDNQTVRVTLSDGRRVDAVRVGEDPLTDLAVLKVDADRLIPIRWGDSDALQVGALVWAVGSPFGLDRTVTFGILSGKHRLMEIGRHGASRGLQDFMQSDVAVNPGNSGGPLVDARGTLVGINTAIIGETYRGVSFSIPSSVARDVYEHLILNGQVHRGYLGVMPNDVPDDLHVGENLRIRGCLIAAVPEAGGPAGRAGLREGDIVTQIDGVAVIDAAHLMRLIAQSPIDRPVPITIRRGDSVLEVRVELTTRPSGL